MEEIEYLEEYEDLVLPAINSDADGTATTKLSKPVHVDSDGSSSSLDQDIFHCLFAGSSDEENDEISQPLKGKKFTQIINEASNDIINVIGEQVKSLGKNLINEEKTTTKDVRQKPEISKNTDSKVEEKSSTKFTKTKSLGQYKQAVEQKTQQVKTQFTAQNSRTANDRSKASTSKTSLTTPFLANPRLNATKTNIISTTSSTSSRSNISHQSKLNVSKQRPATIIKPEKIVTKDPAEDPLNLDDISSAESANYSVSDISGETYNTLSDFDDDDCFVESQIEDLGDEDDDASSTSQVIDISNDSSESRFKFDELRGSTPSPVISDDREVTANKSSLGHSSPKLMSNHKIIENLVIKGERPKLLQLINKYEKQTQKRDLEKIKLSPSDETTKKDLAEKPLRFDPSVSTIDITDENTIFNTPSITLNDNIDQESKKPSLKNSQSSRSETQRDESENDQRSLVSVTKTAEDEILQNQEVGAEMEIDDQNLNEDVLNQTTKIEKNLKVTEVSKDKIKLSDIEENANRDNHNSKESAPIRQRKTRFRNLTGAEECDDTDLITKKLLAEPETKHSDSSHNIIQQEGKNCELEQSDFQPVMSKINPKSETNVDPKKMSFKESFKSPTKTLDKFGKNLSNRDRSNERSNDSSKETLSKVIVNPFVQRTTKTPNNDGRTKISRESSRDNSRESSVDSSRGGIKNLYRDNNKGSKPTGSESESSPHKHQSPIKPKATKETFSKSNPTQKPTSSGDKKIELKSKTHDKKSVAKSDSEHKKTTHSAQSKNIETPKKSIGTIENNPERRKVTCEMLRDSEKKTVDTTVKLSKGPTGRMELKHSTTFKTKELKKIAGTSEDKPSSSSIQSIKQQEKKGVQIHEKHSEPKDDSKDHKKKSVQVKTHQTTDKQTDITDSNKLDEKPDDRKDSKQNLTHSPSSASSSTESLSSPKKSIDRIKYRMKETFEPINPSLGKQSETSKTTALNKSGTMDLKNEDNLKGKTVRYEKKELKSNKTIIKNKDTFKSSSTKQQQTPLHSNESKQFKTKPPLCLNKQSRDVQKSETSKIVKEIESNSESQKTTKECVKNTSVVKNDNESKVHEGMDKELKENKQHMADVPPPVVKTNSNDVSMKSDTSTQCGSKEKEDVKQKKDISQHIKHPNKLDPSCKNMAEMEQSTNKEGEHVKEEISKKMVTTEKVVEENNRTFISEEMTSSSQNAFDTNTSTKCLEITGNIEESNPIEKNSIDEKIPLTSKSVRKSSDCITIINESEKEHWAKNSKEEAQTEPEIELQEAKATEEKSNTTEVTLNVDGKDVDSIPKSKQIIKADDIHDENIHVSLADVLQNVKDTVQNVRKTRSTKSDESIGDVSCSPILLATDTKDMLKKCNDNTRKQKVTKSDEDVSCSPILLATDTKDMLKKCNDNTRKQKVTKSDEDVSCSPILLDTDTKDMLKKCNDNTRKQKVTKSDEDNEDQLKTQVVKDDGNVIKSDQLKNLDAITPTDVECEKADDQSSVSSLKSFVRKTRSAANIEDNASNEAESLDEVKSNFPQKNKSNAAEIPTDGSTSKLKNNTDLAPLRKSRLTRNASEPKVEEIMHKSTTIGFSKTKDISEPKAKNISESEFPHGNSNIDDSVISSVFSEGSTSKVTNNNDLVSEIKSRGTSDPKEGETTHKSTVISVHDKLPNTTDISELNSKNASDSEFPHDNSNVVDSVIDFICPEDKVNINVLEKTSETTQTKVTPQSIDAHQNINAVDELCIKEKEFSTESKQIKLVDVKQVEDEPATVSNITSTKNEESKIPDTNAAIKVDSKKGTPSTLKLGNSADETESNETLTISKDLNPAGERQSRFGDRARSLRKRGTESPLSDRDGDSKKLFKSPITALGGNKLEAASDSEFKLKRRLRSPAAEKEIQPPLSKKFKADNRKARNRNTNVTTISNSASKSVETNDNIQLCKVDETVTDSVNTATTEKACLASSTFVEEDPLVRNSEQDWLKENNRNDSTQSQTQIKTNSQMEPNASSGAESVHELKPINPEELTLNAQNDKTNLNISKQISPKRVRKLRFSIPKDDSSKNAPETIDENIPNNPQEMTTKKIEEIEPEVVNVAASKELNYTISTADTSSRRARKTKEIKNEAVKEKCATASTPIPLQNVSEAKSAKGDFSGTPHGTPRGNSSLSEECKISPETEQSANAADRLSLTIGSFTTKPGSRRKNIRGGRIHVEEIANKDETKTKTIQSVRQDKKHNKRTEIDILMESMSKEMKDGGIKDLLNTSSNVKRQRVVAKKSSIIESSYSNNTTLESVSKEKMTVASSEMDSLSAFEEMSKKSPSRRSQAKKPIRDKNLLSGDSPIPMEMEKALIDEAEIRNMNTSLLEPLKLDIPRQRTSTKQVFKATIPSLVTDGFKTPKPLSPVTILKASETTSQIHRSKPTNLQSKEATFKRTIPLKCRKLRVRLDRNAVIKYFQNYQQTVAPYTLLANKNSCGTYKANIAASKNSSAKKLTPASPMDGKFNMKRGGKSATHATNLKEMREMSKLTDASTASASKKFLKTPVVLDTNDTADTQSLADNIIEPMAAVELKHEFLDENPNSLGDMILPDTPTLMARSHSITQAAASALPNTILPTDIRLLTNDPQSTRAFVPSFGVTPTLVDARGTRMYTFLHPAKYSRNHGNVLLDYCCPNLDGPMPAIDPTRIHAQVQTQVIELPSSIVLTTKVVTRAELDSKSSSVPAVIRKKAEKLRGSNHQFLGTINELATDGVSVQLPRPLHLHSAQYTSSTTGSSIHPPNVHQSVLSTIKPPRLTTPPPPRFSPAINALAKYLPSTTTITAKVRPPLSQSALAIPATNSNQHSTTTSVSVVGKGPTILNEKQTTLLRSNLRRVDVIFKSLVQPFEKLNFTERHQIIDNMVASGKFVPKDLERTIVLMEEYSKQINSIERNQVTDASVSINTINTTMPSIAPTQRPQIKPAPNLADSTLKADTDQKLAEIHKTTTRKMQATVKQQNTTMNSTTMRTVKQRQVPIYDTERNIIGYQLQVIAPANNMAAYSKSPAGINTSSGSATTSSQRKSLKRTAQSSPRVFYATQTMQTHPTHNANHNSMQYSTIPMAASVNESAQSIGKSKNESYVTTVRSAGTTSDGTETITTTTMATVKRVTRSRAAGSKIIIVSKSNSNEETILPDVSHETEIKHEKDVDDFIG